MTSLSALTMAPRARHVRANGLSHHVLEWGDERATDTLVLCHGFLDNAWGFAELGPLLAASGLRVLAFDFRGHGESDRAPEGAYYYFADYILDMHELLASLVEGRFHLLGHSMGGTASVFFAASHPDRIRTLALLEGLGPKGEVASRAPQRMMRWLSQVGPARSPEAHKRITDVNEAYLRLQARHPHVHEPFLRLLAEKSTAPHPDGQGLTWRFDPLHRTSSPIPFEPERFKYFVSAIEAPTLVIEGEHGFRHEAATERRGLLRRSHHALIAGAGHMMHWTHCEEVARLVLEHLRAPA